MLRIKSQNVSIKTISDILKQTDRHLELAKYLVYNLNDDMLEQMVNVLQSELLLCTHRVGTSVYVSKWLAFDYETPEEKNKEYLTDSDKVVCNLSDFNPYSMKPYILTVSLKNRQDELIIKTINTDKLDIVDELPF